MDVEAKFHGLMAVQGARGSVVVTKNIKVLNLAAVMYRTFQLSRLLW
jgi:hypothetical protein